MWVCAFNSFLKDEYLNLFIVAAFSNKFLSGKTSLPVKKPYLQTFPDDKAKTLAVLLSKWYWALFYSILLLIVVIVSVILIL